jgi:hypothetical protein
MSLRNLLIAAVCVVVVACGGKKDSKPAPAKPFTGAPVAVEVTKLNKDSVDVDVYNFADRPVVAYWFLIRYKDADGKVLKVKPGTPFEKDSEFMTMSGNKYKTAPSSWSSFRIEMLEPPDGAKTAEVIVRSVSAASKDGTMVEDDALWELQGMDWPADPKP